MKISTEIGSAAKIIGEEKAIEYYAKAGFTAWDFSMFSMCKYDYKTRDLLPNDHPLAGKDYLKFARKLKQIGLNNGIICNQSHAPFPVYCKGIRDSLKKAIECTAEAGAEYCIIHPDNYKNAKENSEMFLELLPFAKDCGVKIATENMWSWDNEKNHSGPAACSDPESFNAHLDAVNDDFFVACLDIGHAEMLGSNTTAPEMIRALGPRLKALHIHDNDKYRDSHMVPFTMKIDFDSVIAALKEIGYDGYLTLEADAFLSSYNKDNIYEGIKIMAESAKRLHQMFIK